MSKLLITGGAGFIGSNLAETLSNNGHELLLLDIRKDPANLSGITDHIEYINADIRHRQRLEKVLRCADVDGIVHLAAVSRVIWGEEDPARCVDVNVNGTRALLDAVGNAGARPWIIFGSSREVYGEPDSFPVREDFPKAPLNVYGRSKLVGEELVREYTGELALNSVILRFSNVYGNERDIHDRVIPRFVLSGLKGEGIEIHGGGQVVDFTYIDDTVDGIMRTIETLETMNRSGRDAYCDDFHILPGRPLTLQGVVRIISEHLDRELPVAYTGPRDYDVERFHGDPSKAKENLSFEAKITPDRGIPLTLDRFREVLDT